MSVCYRKQNYVFTVMKFVVFSLVLFVGTFAQERERRLVNITQGPVYGYRDPNFDIFVYYDIPYATAPTGPHKFKAPLPPPQWSNPFEAKSRGIVCPQSANWGLIVQEDCLFASVFTPVRQSTKIPVVVYVHGGGYSSGFANRLTPKNLVNSQEVIIVTFNYRLDVHGFLCLGTEDVPGNAGLKDQLALLRWVNKNIESFGGDPSDVTLVGYSTGASAVELLMISKTTKGLFKKVSAESGSSLSFFNFQIDPIYNAKEYARAYFNYNVDNITDIHELEEFYKSLSYDEMFKDYPVNKTNDLLIWAPCVELKIDGESILTESPLKIIKSGDYEKYPLLYGFTNMESLRDAQFFDLLKDRFNANFSRFLPPDLRFENEAQREKVANKVKQFYFGNNLIGSENLLPFINFRSDSLLVYSILRSVKLQVEAGHNNIYLYEYSFFDENSLSVPHTNIRGAEHDAQTLIVLDHDMNKATEAHIKMTEKMRKIWLSFMTTGYPIPANSTLPNWLPVGADRSPHMSLNRTISLKGPALRDRALFWDDIYEKYYREPKPPTLQSKSSRTVLSVMCTYGSLMLLLCLK